MLWAKAAPGENLIVRGARVRSIRRQVDGVMDVRIDGGTIAELGALDPNSLAGRRSGRPRPGTGLRRPARAPAHARTGGRGDDRERDAGCGERLRDPRDAEHRSRRRLGGRAGVLAETAEAEAEVPSGFAAISKGLEGGELTEMAELADAGAARFSDDGRPVATPGLMRARSSTAPSPPAGHCTARGTDASRAARCTRRSLRRARFAGYPSVAESLMVERDLSLAAYEEQARALPAPVGPRVRGRRSGARAAGVRATAEVTPHHLCLTDEAVRSLDSNLKMNPPLRSVDDRAALVEVSRDGTIGAIADRPHARHEKDVPFEAAPFGVRAGDRVRRALHAPRRAGLRQAGIAAGAHVGRPGGDLRPAGAAHRGRRAGEPRPARHESGLARAGRRFAPAPPTPGSSGAPHRQGAHDGRGRHGVGVVTSSSSRTGPSSAASRSVRRASPSARRSSPRR